MKITSSGIIRNEDRPRVGITSKASHEFLDRAITEGIDLTTVEYIKENPAVSDEDMQAFYDSIDQGGPYLIGDWIEDTEGNYIPDRVGADGYAATYSPNGPMGDIVTVEWSRTTKRCHHTSPCFVMANGDGPCGDLDTPGDSVLAFCLPDDCMEGNDQ